MDRVWPLKCLPFQHDACRCNKIETGKVLELLPVSIHLNGSNPELCFMVSCRGSIHYLFFFLGSNSIFVRIRSLWHVEVEPTCRGLNVEPSKLNCFTNSELTSILNFEILNGFLKVQNMRYSLKMIMYKPIYHPEKSQT